MKTIKDELRGRIITIDIEFIFVKGKLHWKARIKKTVSENWGTREESFSIELTVISCSMFVSRLLRWFLERRSKEHPSNHIVIAISFFTTLLQTLWKLTSIFKSLMGNDGYFSFVDISSFYSHFLNFNFPRNISFLW